MKVTSSLLILLRPVLEPNTTTYCRIMLASSETGTWGYKYDEIQAWKLAVHCDMTSGRCEMHPTGRAHPHC
jgi:hypothetical protein